jgi:hypothetical protein
MSKTFYWPSENYSKHDNIPRILRLINNYLPSKKQNKTKTPLDSVWSVLNKGFSKTWLLSSLSLPDTCFQSYYKSMKVFGGARYKPLRLRCKRISGIFLLFCPRDIRTLPALGVPVLLEALSWSLAAMLT